MWPHAANWLETAAVSGYVTTDCCVHVLNWFLWTGVHRSVGDYQNRLNYMQYVECYTPTNALSVQ